ncbi:MAG TPA: dipeptidase [bacterium]|nr:dipeptidase [bacterium]
MKNLTWKTVVCVMLLSPALSACTNFLISKGASADGSVLITYAADSHVLYGELYHTPAARHAPGTMRDVYEWDTGDFLGRIPQPAETYNVVGNINEHQVAIGETTWGGRRELQDSTAILDYGSLMYIVLERAKTAREAIQIMTDLVAEYGYYSSGESFSIADPEEVWILEMIGKGPGNTGAVWVARRVPDGYISAHANNPRIRRFPLNDRKNCLYAPDVITFAREKNYFSGQDEEFSFAEAYGPPDFGALRYCESRVWAMFRRAAPSLDLPPDFIMGNPDAEPVPLWIKPERKLTVQDVMAFMRDHFQGTELDMTRDIGAGPYHLPYRWRPLEWTVDGVTYFNERATSTQQTGFSFVSQSRGWLPGPIGGVLWFGVDDTYSTVYVPMYCGILDAPKPFAVGNGDFNTFTWESAFWVFNAVSNYAYLRYSDMIQDIQKVQQALEGGFVAEQESVDQAALSLYKQAPRLAREYLTQYTADQSDETLRRWRKLHEFMILKYLDGNVRNEHGKVTHPGYPESWYRRIIEETGDRFEVREIQKEE